MLLDISAESIITYLTGLELAKLAAQETSKEVFIRLKNKVFASPTYRQRLQQQLAQFLQDEGYFMNTAAGQSQYFWQLPWTWERVLAYRFFARPTPLVLADLPAVAGLIRPTQAELTAFCERLWAKLDEDSALRQLFIAENYQEAIFLGQQQNEAYFAALSAQIAELRQTLVTQPSDAGDLRFLLERVEEVFIERYRPFTALELLLGLLPYVEQHYRSNNALFARFQFLLGHAYAETGQHAQSTTHFQLAHEREKEQPLYAERAALAYARSGAVPQAQALLPKLLATTHSAVGWAVDTFLRAGTTAELAQQLAAVPLGVASSEQFKYTLANLLLASNRPTDSQLVVAAELIAYGEAPIILTAANQRFQGLVALLVLQQDLHLEDYLQPFQRPARLPAAPRLVAAHRVLVSYADQVRHSELAPRSASYFFLRGMVGYLLTGDEAEFADYQVVFTQVSAAEKQSRGFVWACLLSQWAGPEAALAVLAEVDTSQDVNSEYLRFQLLYELERMADAQASLALHLSRLRSLEDILFYRTLVYLQLFCDSEAQREAFVAGCRQRGQLASPLPRLLLEASVGYGNPANQEHREALLAQVRPLLTAEVSIHYWQQAAVLYGGLQQHQLLAELLAQFPPVPAELVASIERLRLLNRYQLGEGDALRQDLARWRQHHGLDQQLSSWEIGFAQQLGDWELVAELAEAAGEVFPEDTRFRCVHLLGLYHTGRRGQLRPLLQAIADQPAEFSSQQLLNLATLALRAQKADLALALVYPLALDPTNIAARDKFFQLLVFGRPDQPPAVLTTAAIGTVVRYAIEGEERPPLHLTEPILRSGQHPVAAQLVGLSVGNMFVMQDKLRARRLTGQVLAVTDPYTALFHDILTQSRREPGLLSMHSFNLENSSGAGFEQTLVREFGADGLAHQVEVQQALVEYSRGETGFSVFAGNTFSGNGLEAYQFFTSAGGPGFYVPPRQQYDHLPIEANWTYILDWSTLPLLHQLSKRKQLSLPGSLWVSAQLVSALEELVLYKQRSPAPRANVHVAGSVVRGHFYPPDFQAQEIARLQELLAWVCTHCQTRLVPEKLDMLRQADAELSDPDRGEYFDLLLDTAFLANHPHTVLVSDDTLISQILLPCDSVVSSEKFLTALYPERYEADLLPELLALRYVGLTVNPDQLVKLFVAAGGQFTGAAQQYLLSFSANVATDPLALFRMHRFLREVYLLGGLSPEQQSRAAVAVYVAGLQPLVLTTQLRQRLLGCIKYVCRLLPFAEQSLRRDFEQAWQVVEELRESTLLLS